MFWDGILAFGQATSNSLTTEPLRKVRGTCVFDTAELQLDVVPSGSGFFLRGDPNDDGGVDISDGIWLLNELFGDGPPTPCPPAADVNGDGERNISDAVFVLLYAFARGAAPPSPFPDCGLATGTHEGSCANRSCIR